jgi:hypothetical protein
MVKIWEMSLKNGEAPGFPVIIPLVFYHGEKRWRAGLNLKSLFNHPENMVSFMPDFQYLLWDASRYSDEEIKAAVDKALPNIGGEIMPTVADSLRKQGMQQGMQQGILQNAREAVIVDLEVRFETVPRSLVKILNEINRISDI